MKKINGLGRGMGLGGWLTNYKRFNVLPQDRRLCLTIGDMEHFALKALQQPGVADELRQSFVMVLVDEYQDSNEVQDTIFSVLTQNKQNCFMVGDKL